MTDNVLVLGAASFIGINLIKKLISMDCQITAVCRPRSEKNRMLQEQFGTSIQYMELDACSIDSDLSVLEHTSGFDWIYIAAWNGSQRNLRNNTEANWNSAYGLLNCLKTILIYNKCKGVIFLGSQAEYGNLTGVVDENRSAMPCSEYGKAKLFFGKEAANICKEKNIPLFEFRLHSIFGNGMNDGVLKEVILTLLNGKECVMSTNCMQTGDYLYIDDCVDALTVPLNQEIDSGIYNISYGEDRNLRSYFESVRDIVNLKNTIKYSKGQDASSFNFIFSSDKIRRASGWKPVYTFEEGVRKMLLDWGY